MIPKEKLAQCASLAAKQTILREEQVKLLLPAAEAAKEVMNISNPEMSPDVLMESIFESFTPAEEEDRQTPSRRSASSRRSARVLHLHP